MYLEPRQRSKMDGFAKILNDFHPLTILPKGSILDNQQGSDNAPHGYFDFAIKNDNVHLEISRTMEHDLNLTLVSLNAPQHPFGGCII